MNREKQRRLLRKGWTLGSAQKLLSLTDEEAAYIEMKLLLSESVRERRQLKRLTQAQLAKRLKSSQSRIAKIESADASVSVDLLVRSLIALGATRRQVGEAIAAD